ncbi:MAG: hypothetical protein M3Z11_03520 [Candidatus Dormibacteraeota bacterium]|nr:hypothetical protein [Candidatus Dormibacteraeota bacterium]
MIRALRRANLDPQVCAIAFLRFETGMSESEIARVTGLARAAVDAGIAQARMRVRADAGADPEGLRPSVRVS